MMRVLTVTVACMSLAGAAQATTCTGNWGNGAATSVEFKSGGKVKYCYETQCWNTPVYKSGNNYLFRVGNSSASVEMKASGKGFKANWKAGNASSDAKLTCK